MIAVNEKIFLTKLKLSDADTIVGYMRDKEISDNTLVIPFPYSLEDAKTFLEDDEVIEEEIDVQKHYAIRNAEGLLLGILGIHFNFGLEADKTEFGYWLGKRHWNKGIMTLVIGKFCEVAKEKHHLETLEAHVFDFNPASMHILLKNGFTKAEAQVKRVKRNGQEVNAVRFYKNL